MTEGQQASGDGDDRRIVAPAVWQAHLRSIRAGEKELTRAQDRLAAERRRAPWLKMAGHYRFDGPQGATTLAGLFEGRAQLIVYHHMLKPADPSPCAGCCMVADQMPHLAHLHARNTSLAFVSRAPFAEIEAFRARMGWNFPWYSTPDGFNADCDVSDGFGLNVFYRSGDDVYRSYFTTGRGVETLGTVWTLLDLTPLGRQESWEEAPAGTPQTQPYQWWRLHDRYERKDPA